MRNAGEYDNPSDRVWSSYTMVCVGSETHIWTLGLQFTVWRVYWRFSLCVLAIEVQHCEQIGVCRASYYPLFLFSSSWVYVDKNVDTTIHFLTAALNNVIYPSGKLRNNKSCCFGQKFYHTNKELLIALI